jgi:hypothetical protein
VTTNKKVKVLTENNEDFEWYPTTDEILATMNKDLHWLFTKGNLAGYTQNRINQYFGYTRNYDRETKEESYTYHINSFMDVGAGDGRVFGAVKGVNGDITIEKNYGIEIAQSQADDLINRDVFIIGRDFFKTTLIDKRYSVIFSNPPYSVFVPWVQKLLDEANFGVMYLVLPVRWETSIGKHPQLMTYSVKKIGEFDFNNADRSARAKVHLIRINPKPRKVEEWFRGDSLGTHIEYGDKDDSDSFERWMDTHIGHFKEDDQGLEEANDVALKNATFNDLVKDYDYNLDSLLEAFKALGRLPYRVIEALGMDRKSILETIKENIKTHKHRYWRLAFDRISTINSRLTNDTRKKLLNQMDEFNTLDFNEDNLYSIIVWVVKHFNEYTGEQILSVFDQLTRADFVRAYKSNVHWIKDNWRYGSKPKPEKYKLDYRLVTHWYKSYLYDPCVLDDFIVICRSLGYYIRENTYIDCERIGTEQKFYTVDGVLAFTTRLYKNRNAHIKVNQDLMMKFNIEVAKLRKWINNHRDIEDEFEVSEEEAIRLWNEPSLKMIGKSELKLLGYNEELCA